MLEISRWNRSSCSSFKITFSNKTFTCKIRIQYEKTAFGTNIHRDKIFVNRYYPNTNVIVTYLSDRIESRYLTLFRQVSRSNVYYRKNHTTANRHRCVRYTHVLVPGYPRYLIGRHRGFDSVIYSKLAGGLRASRGSRLLMLFFPVSSDLSSEPLYPEELSRLRADS